MRTLGLAGFRQDAPFRPWLLRIVVNEAHNRRRLARRRARAWQRFTSGRPTPDPAPSPEAAVLASESRHELDRWLATLPARDRQVITARYVADLSEAEMAVVLACAPGTVKSRLARAIQRVRRQLEPIEAGAALRETVA